LAGLSVIIDANWGCGHLDMPAHGTESIRVCHVTVTDISKLATELTKVVLDTSWMAGLDIGAKQAYERTVSETAQVLVTIFSAAPGATEIAEDFGEVMVSMGSARALFMVCGHSQVPLAELWKPQVKQNEGFDFHTVCTGELINFGEAKYSSISNPHGVAIKQIGDFLTAEKHHRDYPHLASLVSPQAIENLTKKKFGVVAAFSVNSSNKDLVMKNACKSAKGLAGAHEIAKIYLVGVSHEA
jgi:hypothetical protein